MDLEKFQAVPPRIFREEPLRIRQGIILGDSYGPGQQRFTKLVQISDSEGRMRFLGRLKRGFHADVKLLISALKPAAAARAERRRLLDFRQAKNRSVELTSRGLAALWSGQLDVIDTNYYWIHLVLERSHLATQPHLNSSPLGAQVGYRRRRREKPLRLRGAIAGTCARSP
jgi:hypothetical protein